MVKRKLESYINSAYVLDHIVSVKPTRGEGVGYNKCPPPMHNNFSMTPEVEKSLDIKVKTPLVVEPEVVKPSACVSEVIAKVTRSLSSESEVNFEDCDDLVDSTTSDGDFVEVEDVLDAEELNRNLLKLHRTRRLLYLPTMLQRHRRPMTPGL